MFWYLIILCSRWFPSLNYYAFPFVCFWESYRPLAILLLRPITAVPLTLERKATVGFCLFPWFVVSRVHFLTLLTLEVVFFLCRFPMAKKQSLVFPTAMPLIYRWVDSEVLGIPSKVTSAFLKSLREEHLLTLECEYEEEYLLEAPTVDERVCHINLHGSPSWMWMYDVLSSKFGVRISFTYFQFSVLERTRVAPSQLYPNS